MSRLTPVDTEEDDFGVCPNPSPSNRTNSGSPPSFHFGRERTDDAHPVHERRQEPSVPRRIVAGKPRHRPDELSALVNRPFSLPGKRPALPIPGNGARREQVEAFLDLVHQGVGDLVEGLVGPQHGVELLFQQLVKGAFVVFLFRTQVQFGMQSPPEALRQFSQASHRRREKFICSRQIDCTALLVREQLGILRGHPVLVLVLIVEVGNALLGLRAVPEHVAESKALIDVVQQSPQHDRVSGLVGIPGNHADRR